MNGDVHAVINERCRTHLFWPTDGNAPNPVKEAVLRCTQFLEALSELKRADLPLQLHCAFLDRRSVVIASPLAMSFRAPAPQRAPIYAMGPRDLCGSRL